MSQFGTIMWTRSRIGVHLIEGMRDDSALKIVVVSVSAVMIWFLLLLGFLQGFGWLQTFLPETSGEALSLGDILMVHLLSVFALALFFMLIFSNVLIAFSTLYKAREVHYLLHAPLPIRTFFLSRFVECVSFSSWASAYLGSPLILAYGVTTDAPWVYYVAAIAFYVPFVTIPAAMGAICTLVFVYVFPKLPRLAMLVLVGLAVLTLFMYFRVQLNAARLSENSTVAVMLQVTSQTQSPFLPSHWASQGILAAAQNRPGEMGFYFLLLLSNALFITWIAAECANRLFLTGFSTLLGGDQNQDRPLDRGLLGRLDGLLGFLPNPIKPLVVKDVKLFWRDPTQWTQFVVFFGIMAVYVAQLGNQDFGERESYRSWIAGLNSVACSLILASLTSRFAYPMISLEGFRFWILGLAPLTIGQLMWQKFWLSVCATSSFTVTLVVLSCWFLEVGAIRFGVAVYSIFLANLALAGLAVGLGSIYPNFEEDNPARIVSGMGGTLNFLLSVGYVTLLVGTQMVILQWDALQRYTQASNFHAVLAFVLVFNTVLTIAATWIPMKLGLKNLTNMEF